jgi:hypothetical protein
MSLKGIDRLVLMDQEGHHIVCGLHKLYRNPMNQQVMVISQRNIYYRVVLSQTETGITELHMGSEKYRVSVITFRSGCKSKYVIADSFDHALDLTEYIS